mmetsp:Transcript_9746/g.29613  ORF Transcript_9746/g.29613 Transcript_9746/m.29613 type:complete len:148 (-) Transcript_9746:14-457(-)
MRGEMFANRSIKFEMGLRVTRSERRRRHRCVGEIERVSSIEDGGRDGREEGGGGGHNWRGDGHRSAEMREAPPGWMVQAMSRMLDFLDEVDAFPCLYGNEAVLWRAVGRYEHSGALAAAEGARSARSADRRGVGLALSHAGATGVRE